MSLGFILGTAAMDHQQAMVERLSEDMKRWPNDKFYYLVPNHIKFESEIDVLSRLSKLDGEPNDMYAQSNLQVLSFSRLAWFFLRDTAEYQVPRITPTGLNMLVFQIMKNHQAELKLYAGEADQPGFVTEVTKQLEELKQANISSEDLNSITQTIENSNQTLTSKLHDLNIIYREYELSIAGQYMGNSEMYQQLAHFIESENFEHTHFYLDRFSQFTATEQKIVEAIIKQANSTVVALTLDKATNKETIDSNQIFIESGRTYRRLYNVAVSNGIHLILDEYAKTSRVTEDMVKLEKLLIADAKMAQIEPEPLVNNSSVKIFTADSRLTELQQVARQIRQMVATGKYRYRDFLVLTKHIKDYGSSLVPTFAQFEIPMFDDHEKLMNAHPLVSLLKALFDVKAHFYRHNDVMQLLKTELLIPKIVDKPMQISNFQDALAVTENWLLKNGVQGSSWIMKNDWQFYQSNNNDDDEQIKSVKVDKATSQINVIRNFVNKNLPPFFAALDEAVDGKEAATVLYQFLVDNGVTDQLKEWFEQQNDLGNLDVADRAQQVWAVFCDTLDEYVAILGDEPFNADDFSTLMQAGFETAAYSQIPSTLDQVIISEIGIVQSQKKKVVFVIGATDQVMPEIRTSETLLSDLDKDTFESQLNDNQFLPAGNAEQLPGEAFVNYLALMNGTEKLIASYPSMDEDGREYQKSAHLTAISRHFNVPIEVYLSVPALNGTDATAYVATKSSTLSNLVKIQRQSIEQQALRPDVWLFIDNYLKKDEVFSSKYFNSMGGLTYKNIPAPLRPEIVEGLYGHSINTSVSKLETFYQNEYAYFLTHGLKLRERDEFELSPANSGQLFHSVLDKFIKTLSKKDTDLRKISMDEIKEIIPALTQEVLLDPQYLILSSSNRMNYIARQLESTALHMAQILKQQSSKSRMLPFKTEVLFGQVQGEKGIDGLEFALPNDNQVLVRGMIDRIDTMETEKGNRRFMGIVDYKSGETKLNFAKVYDGTQMQMMTYLNVLRQDAKQLGLDENDLSSAFYMHVKNPIISLKDLKFDVEKQMLRASQYKGMLVTDQDLLTGMDMTYDGEEATWNSDVYPLAAKKGDNEFKVDNSFVTQEQMDFLLDRNQERIINAATKIFAGSVELNPARWSNKDTALKYSPYLDIMQFDAMLPDNNYHELTNMKNSDFLKKLKGGKN